MQYAAVAVKHHRPLGLYFEVGGCRWPCRSSLGSVTLSRPFLRFPRIVMSASSRGPVEHLAQADLQKSDHRAFYENNQQCDFTVTRGTSYLYNALLMAAGRGRGTSPSLPQVAVVPPLTNQFPVVGRNTAMSLEPSPL